MQHTPDPTRSMDDIEIVNKLREAGFEKLLDALQDEKVYTNGGRLNITALAKRMRKKTNTVDRLLKELRKLAEELSGDSK